MLYTKLVVPFGSSFIDYPDNYSISVITFFVGCDNNCDGCHNEKLKDREYGSEDIKTISTDEYLSLLYHYAKIFRTKNVVMTGGDPLSIYNIDFVIETLSKNNDFNFCIYTGHDIKYVIDNKVRGFKFIKTGKFDYKLRQEPVKNDDKMVLASTNQMIYNENFELLTSNGVLAF